ncbi:MAG: PD40 domain-containing protein, partial [Phycisphaerales bacterium]
MRIGGWLLCAWCAALFADDGAADQGDRFLSNVQWLTREGARAGEGYFSPDGHLLIFQSEREPGNPFFQIYIKDLGSGETHRVSPGLGKTTCSFFRAGTDEVLFASTHLDPQAKAKQEQKLTERAAGRTPRHAWDYDDQYDIFSCRRDGSRLKRLTDAPGYDAEGAYSPDGSKIVFCSMRDQPALDRLSDRQRETLEADPPYFAEIYIMNADGSEQTRLTDWPEYDGGPFFSPDGTRIVWRHFERGGRLADVYTMK